MKEIKTLFEREDVSTKFKDLLGKKSTAFITSVLQIVSQNDLLKTADPTSVYQAAAVAATLDLPLNSNLGFAYIVPYKNKAQFQIGYKGYIQLAQRSRQYKTINVTDVKEGEIKSFNRLTGTIDFAWINSDAERNDIKTIGYVAYFELNNGFYKCNYMSVENIQSHGLKYSQSFKKGYGLWKDDFDSMAKKTVLKLLLVKFGPLSVDLQTAITTDQAVINNADSLDIDYVDQTKEVVDKERERVLLMLSDCKTAEDVDTLANSVPDFDIELFASRKEEIRNGK
jgi:recombination protein RecT